MLGRAGTKKDLFTDILKQGLYKKGKWGWSEKAQFTENCRGRWYKKAPLTKYVMLGFLV